MTPRLPRLCCLIVPIAVLLSVSGAVAAAGVDGVDNQLIEEIYTQTNLAESQPAPGFGAYAGHLVREALAALFPPLADRVSTFLNLSTWFWLALGAGALVTAIALLLQGFSQRRVIHSEGKAAEIGVEFEQQPKYSPQEWIERHRRAMQAGDLAAALEALWWWVASVLSPPGLDSSWTTRQLTRFAGNDAIRIALRRLDELAFGTASADRSDVVALQSSLASDLQAGGLLAADSSGAGNA